MNTLSWLLYLAEVSGNLSSFLFAVSLALVFGIVVWVVAGFLMTTEETVAGDEKNWKIWRKIGKLLLPTAFSLFIASCLIPSKETVYAIAASEMGEEILNGDTGNKAKQALNAWLDRQITGKVPTTEETE